MKLVLNLIILISSISIGYIDLVIPSYVNLFPNSGLNIHGNLNQFKKTCSKKRSKSICREKYVIPINNFEYDYLGLGFFSSATKIYCIDKPNEYIEFSNIENPNLFFDIINKYQVINLRSLNCKSNIVIESWSKLDSLRTGYQKGLLAEGDYIKLSRIENLSVFFSTYSYLFIAFFLITIYLTSLIVSKKTLNLYQYNFILSSPLWFLYLLFSTGFVQKILPFPVQGSLISNFVWGFSFLAHISPVYFKTKSKNLKIGYLLMSLIFLVLGYNNIQLWYYFFVVIFLLYIFYSIKFRDSFFIILFVSVLMTYLKVLNFSHMPSGRTSTYTFFFIVCYQFFYILKNVNFQLIISRDFKDSLKSDKDIYQSNVEGKVITQSFVHDLRSPLTVLESLVDSSNVLIADSLTRINSLITNENNSFMNSTILNLKIIDALVKEKNFIHNCELSVQFTSFDEVVVDKYSLRIISNIIDNSVEAAKNKRNISLKVGLKNNFFILEINNETAIREDILNKLNCGDSFTTKENGQGIGSSSAFQWLKKNNGKIDYNKRGKVTLTIPLVNGSSDGSEA